MAVSLRMKQIPVANMVNSLGQYGFISKNTIYHLIIVHAQSNLDFTFVEI